MHQLERFQVSIITVCLNNREGLLRTIMSVRSQEGVRIEHIVVDGGSADGSLEVIHKYEDGISKWISEADQGPYFGMNKGLNLAKGEWIHFLNAGDVFVDKDSLSGIVGLLDGKDADAVYTDSLADYGSFRLYRRALPFNELWKGMVFSHQALLIRASVLKQFEFDTRYKKIADYDLILRCLTEAEKVRYKPYPLVSCEAFGISTRGQASVLMQYYRCARQYMKMNLKKKFYYVKSSLLLMTVDLVKMMLSQKLFLDLVKFLRKEELY